MLARICCCSLAALALLAPTASAQAPPQPTKFHQELAREAGVWDAEVQTWMAPGAPPETSKAVETNKMLGGFWLTSRFEGNFMGTPFTGEGQYGYDEATGEYVGTWIDSLAPAMAQMRGKYDVATHTLTMTSSGKDWMTGEEKDMKMVTRYTDADHKVFEIHEAPKGSTEWRKTMEASYTRRK